MLASEIAPTTTVVTIIMPVVTGRRTANRGSDMAQSPAGSGWGTGAPARASERRRDHPSTIW
jgi:hypothetical protein